MTYLQFIYNLNEKIIYKYIIKFVKRIYYLYIKNS